MLTEGGRQRPSREVYQRRRGARDGAASSRGSRNRTAHTLLSVPAPPTSDPMAPRLSVVLAAMHDSPELRSLHRGPRSAAGAGRGELLVVDGSPGGELAAIAAASLPGADVFALRAAGGRQARGRVVAFTEDHCSPADGLVRAPARRARPPPAHGRRRRRDRQRRHFDADGLGELPRRLRTVPAPAALDRRARLPDSQRLGQARGPRRARAHAGAVRARDRPAPAPRRSHRARARRARGHVQSHGRWRTLLAHFDNGRASASLPRRSPPLRERLVRTGNALLLPLRLVPATIARGLRHRPSRVPRCVPRRWSPGCSPATAPVRSPASSLGPGGSPSGSTEVPRGPPSRSACRRTRRQRGSRRSSPRSAASRRGSSSPSTRVSRPQEVGA